MLGAIWLADQREAPWPCVAPALLGAPRLLEEPTRNPGLDPDRALPLVTLQSDTRSKLTRAVELHVGAPAIDARAAVRAQPLLCQLVSQAETPGASQRLAVRVLAACRLASLSSSVPVDLAILHLVVALEALVSDHEATAGVTDRFVRRLVGLLGRAAPTRAELQALYNARSQVGHQGFSPAPLIDLAEATTLALRVLTEAVCALAETSAVQGLTDDEALLRWLDLAGPPASRGGGAAGSGRSKAR